MLEGDFVVVNKFKYGLKLPIIGTKLIPIGGGEFVQIFLDWFDYLVVDAIET